MLFTAFLVANAEKQRVVGVDKVNVHDARLGRDAIELHPSGAVLIVVELWHGGEDQPVVIVGQVDHVALGQHHCPIADVVLPVGRVGEFDEVFVAVIIDGMNIVVVAALAVAVGGSGGEPHAGVVVVELAVGIGDVLLGEVRDGALGNVAGGVELNLADAVVRLVAVLDDLPVAVVSLISVAKARVAGNTVFQKISARVDRSVDL